MSLSLNKTVAAGGNPVAGLFYLDIVTLITAIYLAVEYQDEVARGAPQANMISSEKTQELDRQLVEKALAGRANKRWNEFFNIVKSRELSWLANTMDSNLVDFINQVLD